MKKLKIINECVDRISGKRLFPGEFYMINEKADRDAVETEIARLTKAGCLKEVDVADEIADDKLDGMKKDELIALAGERKVDISAAKTKDDIIAALRGPK